MSEVRERVEEAEGCASERVDFSNLVRLSFKLLGQIKVA